MIYNFLKYQGTGNDFLMIDNRTSFFDTNNVLLIRKMCDRHFGIGADGLILLENDALLDFRMNFFNADGKPGSMCGNGARCIVAFAKRLEIVKNKASFVAPDGLHQAIIRDSGMIALAMKNVCEVNVFSDYVFLDTGSPHYVSMALDLEKIDIKKVGATIRYSDFFAPGGTNVNYVKQINQDTFAIRTYERGVEDETLSCGTGATAVAIAMKKLGKTIANQINIEVAGGLLKIRFVEKENQFTEIFLEGPAEFVFEGQFEL